MKIRVAVVYSGVWTDGPHSKQVNHQVVIGEFELSGRIFAGILGDARGLMIPGEENDNHGPPIELFISKVKE